MASTKPIGIGRNLTYSLEGEELVIRMKFATRLGPSKSGKNINVATTGGNVAVALPDGVVMRVGLNAYVDAAE